MALLIRLTSGDIEVDKDVSEFAELLQAARSDGRMLELENSSGDTVVIVPEHVVYFTDKLTATATGPVTNGARALRSADAAPPRQ